MHEHQPPEQPETARRAAEAHWIRLCHGDELLLPEFRNCYLGCWNSRTAFGADFAAELGLPQRLAQLDTQMRPYLQLDVEALVDHLEATEELALCADQHGVHVFIDPGRPTEPEPETRPPSVACIWSLQVRTGGASTESRVKADAMSEREPTGAHREEPAASGSLAGREGEPRLRPRIYVASLSDYNAGRLHGTWLDADVELGELQEGVASMLTSSIEQVAEEWAIHDYQDFGGLRLDEYESLETVARLGRGIAEHGPAFAALASWLGPDAATIENFEQRYRGRWDSAEAYAEELMNDLGAQANLDRLPVWLQPYAQLNVAGFARDLELSGDIYVSPTEGGVYVFDCQV